jgi:hypothetical protein
MEGSITTAFSYQPSALSFPEGVLLSSASLALAKDSRFLDGSAVSE